MLMMPGLVGALAILALVWLCRVRFGRAGPGKGIAGPDLF